MRSLFRLLGLSEPTTPERRDTETVRRIAAQLDQLDAEQARYLASFAYVLARVAHVDHDVSEEELREMEKLVRELGALSEAQAALVVQIAKTQAITLGATENYVVTRQFRENSTRDQRLRLLRCLFAVAAADQNVSEVENTEIAMIATELGLTGPEIAAARAAYRQYLAVLKDMPRS
jgi:uncharacterized tellurite resistance protein B-like protein